MRFELFRKLLRVQRSALLLPLRDELGEAGDLPFNPLDLSGLAHGARQQLHDMRELCDLLTDGFDVERGAAARFDLALNALEAANKPAHGVREFIVARGGGRLVCRRRRRRWNPRHGRSHRGLARTDLVDRRLQRVTWIGRHVVTL